MANAFFCDSPLFHLALVDVREAKGAIIIANQVGLVCLATVGGAILFPCHWEMETLPLSYINNAVAS
jgi:hypothetical protein